MKIGPLDNKAAITPVVTDRKSAVSAQPVKAGPVSGPGAEPSAQVALSAAAKLPGASEVDAATFDSAKVERISQAIRDGKFVINAEAIADKLIVNAEELLGRASRN